MGAWWTWPENFDAPLVFYLTEEQEKDIFGPGDAFLPCIEKHSHTLIQLEPWFTATGHTQVTVVGPPKARQWLRNMAQYLGHQDARCQAQGLEMLQHVRSQPLTKEDLAFSFIASLIPCFCFGNHDE
ncbi:putative KHDC1-like protein [Dipodomys spectabilis]|uniref:putative KHDC1-like protein n=1 Tax=Dipodomys spectabilis TaxID=105255 RepID=UPI001C5481A9|nr:putative KHDC1-like protein [Dipodomys spectabilis]